ncbi:MAG: DUF4916 domain-containing protein [Thermoplasmatales archaeon]
MEVFFQKNLGLLPLWVGGVRCCNTNHYFGFSGVVDRKERFEEKYYKRIQRSLPIVTVDILPLRYSTEKSERLESVGLISRETADEGVKWCLVGGRLLYGEQLSEAISRQISDTLGEGLKVITAIKDQQPLYIAQYFPSGDSPFLRDPRQHSIGLTYALELEGRISPKGEALDFKWFNPARLPKSSEFGFGHDKLVRTLLECLTLRF